MFERNTGLRRTLFGATVVASLLLAGLTTRAVGQTDPPAATKDTLAVIAGQPISAADFKADWTKSHAAGARGAGGFEPLEARLDEMVRFEMLYAAATSAGYDRKPDVQEGIRRLIVDRYMADVLLPDLAAITVEADEVEAYYAEHPAAFAEPAASRGAVVQVTVPRTASAEKRAELRQRAETARSEALALGPAVATFGAVAVKHSDDQATRYRGGEMGWIADGDAARLWGAGAVGGAGARWEPPVLAALKALEEPGAVSPVIETDSGYYVVKLAERRAERAQELAVVRNRVSHAVQQEKVHRVKQELFERLAGDLKLELYPERLRSMPELAELAAIAVLQPPANPN